MNKLKKIKYLILLLLYLVSVKNLLAQDQNDLSLFQLALSYERSANPENATQIFQNLHQKYPNYKEFYDAYRRNLEYLKKYNESIEIINKWMITHQSDIDQLGYLGVDYSKINEIGKSEESWKRAINLSPKNINTYRILANVVLESRMYEKAMEFFLLGRKECSNPDVFIVEVASLYAILQNYESAIKEYIKILKNDPNQLGYLQSLMVNYVEDPSFLKLAVKVIKDELSNNKNNISFYYMLSWLYNEQKDYDEALNISVFLEKSRANNGIEIFNFAEKASRENVPEIAAKAYKLVIDDYSNSPMIPNCKYGYALAMEALSNNKSNAFLDSSLTLSKSFPSSEVVPLYTGVINLYESIVREYPKTLWAGEAQIKIGTIKLDKYYDLDGALLAFNNVAVHTPNAVTLVNSILRTGEILVMQNKLNEAIAKFESINAYGVQENLKDMAKFKLAEINYFNSNFLKATKQLEEITKNISADFTNDALLLLNFIQSNIENDSADLKKFAKAELLERQRKLSEAMAEYKNIIESNPRSGLMDEAYLKIASIYSYQNNYADALLKYSEIIQKFSDGAFLDKVFFSIAEIYQFGLKDNQKSIETYDKLLKDFPNSFFSAKARKRIRDLRGESNL